MHSTSFDRHLDATANILIRFFTKIPATIKIGLTALLAIWITSTCFSVLEREYAEYRNEFSYGMGMTITVITMGLLVAFVLWLTCKKD